MEPLSLQPILRVRAVGDLTELANAMEAIPGPKFTVQISTGARFEGFRDEAGGAWICLDHFGAARPLADALEFPFLVSYPIAPELTVQDQPIVRAGMIRTTGERAVYESHFATSDGDSQGELQAVAVDSAGHLWGLTMDWDTGVLIAAHNHVEQGGGAGAVTEFSGLSVPLLVLETD